MTAAHSHIKDTNTQTFQADVLETSKQVPVIVDFWAPWCGPCRQLGPAIEKVVGEKAGKVKLVKINVDENQALAGQMGVQSIPSVFAFVGGKPVDGFMGALPESEIRKFVDKVMAGAPAGNDNGLDEKIAEALAAADESLAAGEFDRAGQIYAMVLDAAPDNLAALAGLGRLYLRAGEPDKTRELIDSLEDEARADPAIKSLITELALAEEAAGLGDPTHLAARVAENPNDHEARFDLATLLNASGERLAAATELVEIMRRDRAWNDEAARKKLLTLFEAWGPKDPATLKGRRLLSSVLFS